MNSKRRMTESMRRREDRWRREDEANRLHEEVPSLSSMSIEIREHSRESGQPPTCHKRRIPVGSASAHFEIPCTEKKCEDGGYDITAAVMDGLRKGETSFGGTLDCYGHLPETDCPRSVRWIVDASYADKSDEQADAA